MWCYHQLVVALKFCRATKSTTKLFHQATTWLRDGRENLKKVRVWCLYNVVLPSASLNATNSFVTSNYRHLKKDSFVKRCGGLISTFKVNLGGRKNWGRIVGEMQEKLVNPFSLGWLHRIGGKPNFSIRSITSSHQLGRSLTSFRHGWQSGCDWCHERSCGAIWAVIKSIWLVRERGILRFGERWFLHQPVW